MTPGRGNQGSLQDVPKVLLSVQQVLRKLRRHLVDLGLMCALHEDGEAAQGLLAEWKCTFVGVRGCAYHFTATAMTSLLESFASRSRMAVQMLGHSMGNTSVKRPGTPRMHQQASSRTAAPTTRLALRPPASHCTGPDMP